MYHTTGVGKLSETQKSKLRNGHPVRIKIGSGNNIHLTDPQIKKLQAAHKKGAAYTIIFHPEQAEKLGEGFFGDIASKAKKFAISTVKKNRDLINPIIGRARSYAKSGIQKLADKANEKVDYYTPEIEGEGIIGDTLKSLIGMTGLGVKPKTLKSTLKSLEAKKPRKGKGILGNIIKSVAPAAIDAIASAATSAAKDKVAGMGAKRKPGRPKKAGRPKSTTKKGPGRPRKGGALIAPGYSAGE